MSRVGSPGTPGSPGKDAYAHHLANSLDWRLPLQLENSGTLEDEDDRAVPGVVSARRRTDRELMVRVKSEEHRKPQSTTFGGRRAEVYDRLSHLPKEVKPTERVTRSIQSQILGSKVVASKLKMTEVEKEQSVAKVTSELSMMELDESTVRNDTKELISQVDQLEWEIARREAKVAEQLDFRLTLEQMEQRLRWEGETFDAVLEDLAERITVQNERIFKVGTATEVRKRKGMQAAFETSSAVKEVKERLTKARMAARAELTTQKKKQDEERMRIASVYEQKMQRFARSMGSDMASRLVKFGSQKNSINSTESDLGKMYQDYVEKAQKLVRGLEVCKFDPEDMHVEDAVEFIDKYDKLTSHNMALVSYAERLTTQREEMLTEKQMIGRQYDDATVNEDGADDRCFPTSAPTFAMAVDSAELKLKQTESRVKEMHAKAEETTRIVLDASMGLVQVAQRINKVMNKVYNVGFPSRPTSSSLAASKRRESSPVPSLTSSVSSMSRGSSRRKSAVENAKEELEAEAAARAVIPHFRRLSLKEWVHLPPKDRNEHEKELDLENESALELAELSPIDALQLFEREADRVVHGEKTKDLVELKGQSQEFIAFSVQNSRPNSAEGVSASRMSKSPTPAPSNLNPKSVIRPGAEAVNDEDSESSMESLGHRDLDAMSDSTESIASRSGLKKTSQRNYKAATTKRDEPMFRKLQREQEELFARLSAKGGKRSRIPELRVKP